MINKDLPFLTPTHYLINVSVILAKMSAQKYSDSRDTWIESLQTDEDKQNRNLTIRHPVSGIEIHHTEAERYNNSDQYKPLYIQWKDEYEEKFNEISDLFDQSYQEIDDLVEEYALLGIKITEHIPEPAVAVCTAYQSIPEAIRADENLMKEVFENNEEVYSYVKEHSQTVFLSQGKKGKEIIEQFNKDKSHIVELLNKYFGLSILMSF